MRWESLCFMIIEFQFGTMRNTDAVHIFTSIHMYTLSLSLSL